MKTRERMCAVGARGAILLLNPLPGALPVLAFAMADRFRLPYAMLDERRAHAGGAETGRVERRID